MFCPRCGTANHDQAIACYKCGQGLVPSAQASPPYAFPPAPCPREYGTPPEAGSGKAIASLVLGIASLLTWCLPPAGLATSITGLVLGLKAMRSTSRGMAIAGVILCGIGLAASLVNGAYGAYLGATGQHPLIRR